MYRQVHILIACLLPTLLRMLESVLFHLLKMEVIIKSTTKIAILPRALPFLDLE